MYLFKTFIILAALSLLGVLAQYLGACPHLSIDEGKYQMNAAGIVDTVTVSTHLRGFVIVDNDVPLHFKQTDIFRYSFELGTYSFYIMNRKEFMLDGTEMVYTFKKI